MTMRDAFYRATASLLADDPRAALVLADISAAAMSDTLTAHPDRAINVGIREQLMVSVAGGLALTGLRPIAHSYAPFLIERAWEQIKLDLNHQDASAILVSVGASYDDATAGGTHFAPGDVALLNTLDGWTVHVPGHPDEVAPLLSAAAAHDDRVYLRLSTRSNRHPYPAARGLVPVRTGDAGVIVAVGPVLDAVLAATDGLDATVAYTHTPRPFDGDGLRRLVTPAGATVVMVEPYLAGTSAAAVSQALVAMPHRLISLGVGRRDLHRYGSAADHDAAHGLDVAGLRDTISAALW
jgi:transketolase